MSKKIITVSLLSLFAIVSLGLNHASASEIIGTLSSSAVSSGGTTGGSISGSVTGGSTVTGTVSGSGGAGRPPGGSGGGGIVSAGQVLGASIGPTDPGFPATGRAEQEGAGYAILAALLLMVAIFPVRMLIDAKN